MALHVMLDLETLGTAPGAAILSIGAVKFNPDTGDFSESFYANVSLLTCLLAGLSVDPDTLAWWRTRSPEARAALLFGEILPLEQALQEFAHYLTTNSRGEHTGQPVLWCKGGSFDFPLLGAAYRAIGQAVPWKYYNERCCRTVFKVCEHLHGFTLPAHPATAHNALDDARHQAQQLLACLALLEQAKCPVVDA